MGIKQIDKPSKIPAQPYPNVPLYRTRILYFRHKRSILHVSKYGMCRHFPRAQYHNF
jgi:hypothetical protein